MSLQAKTGDPAEEFQKHFQDMLRKANVSFMFGSPQADEKKEQSDDGGKPAAGKDEDALRRIREFNLCPHDVRDYLDRYVIRQDEAKKVLSVAICDHYNYVRRCIENPSFAEKDHAKHNIVLLGPTGVGKTYLLRCAARLVGVPFVKADATKFSETGYVGHDVEDLVRDLVRVADGNTDLAQYGIIFLDEIDKIASTPSSAGRDVSGRGVQVNLLKLMEDTDVNLLSQTDLVGQVQAVMEMQQGRQRRRMINTRHMLFIVSGAFDKMLDIVKRRIESSRIGFGVPRAAAKSEADCMRMAETRDFVEFGFEPEFIGRLPIRVVCDQLSADDLEQVLLRSEGSVLSQYKADFEGYGIEMIVAPEAVKSVAVAAEAEKTGARGLMTVLEKTLRNLKFELPSANIKSFALTGAAVADPSAFVGSLLKKGRAKVRNTQQEQVDEFAAQFAASTCFRLRFTASAVAELSALAETANIPLKDVCEERFKNLKHGLNLVSRNTANKVFVISARFVANPDRELSRLIAESFGREE